MCTRDYNHVYLDVPSMYSIYIPYIPSTSHLEGFVHCDAFLKVPVLRHIPYISQLSYLLCSILTIDTALFVHGQINLTSWYTDYKVL
jgi:hypothetical protein